MNVSENPDGRLFEKKEVFHERRFITLKVFIRARETIQRS